VSALSAETSAMAVYTSSPSWAAPRALDLLDADCRAHWAVWLRARNVRYLVVDCLRPILDALGLDESHESGRWLVGLDALLRDAGIPEAAASTTWAMPGLGSVAVVTVASATGRTSSGGSRASRMPTTHRRDSWRPTGATWISRRAGSTTTK
jgi:hypothetical protein